jgi:tetratricopeptide (TPR) repeat protein
MSRSHAIPLCLTLCEVFLCCVLAPAAAEPSPWLEIHSAHFTVITDAGDKKGREVALRFEQMRAVFATLLGKEHLNQSIPLTILAFKNDKSYYQVAPLAHVEGQAGQLNMQPIGVPGFFLPGNDQDFIVLNLFEEESWRAVAHDFAVMLLNYNYPPAQGWFDEGLAEYFSSIRVDNKQVELGSDPELVPSATQDLLGNERDTHPPKSLTELLGSQVWLSLPDLFTMKHDTSTRNEGTHHTLYYAESWIVMHYLLHEQNLPETGTYFDLILNQHVPVEDAIQKAYGISSVQFEQAVKDYFHAQSALLSAVDAARQTNSNPASAANTTAGQAYRFPAPIGPDDSTITSRSLPESDARALYFEIAIRIPERRDFGLQELRALATAPTLADKKFEARKEEKRPGEDPDLLPSNAMGNALAHRILAWDHIQRGEFAEAATELSQASALNPSDMWLRYYVSVLKYRSAQTSHTDIQGLPNMMLDLRSVLEWYPEFADAYDLLAVARNAGGGPAAALQAERAAINLSPRDERYAYHLAQIYVAGKKWEAANVLLDRLKASGNPQIAALARDLIGQAETERKYGIVGSAGTQPKFAPQKSPFDVLEEDAAKRAAAEKSAQSGEPGDQRPTKFFKGRLVAVDCSQAPAAILTIATESATLKLRAADYKSLLLIGADDFSCDWQNRQVTVNYKPGGAKDGDLVSLEVR